jgi:spermidine synthase
VLIAVWGSLDPGPWDVRLLSAGAFRRKVRPVPTWAVWRARLQREAVIFSADGPDATVAVLERDGGRVLKVNGKPDASSRGDMLTQVASAWVPAVLAKRAERILVIGLGSGVTAGAASRLTKGVEVVEIAPAVVDAARHFGQWNQGVVDNPDVAMHVDDARAWLARTDKRWDVIISEPSNPWVAGNGALFTREFFQLARSHLTPGGVMAQWFHAYEMDDDLLRLVLRTVADSFPHVSLWTLFPGDLLLIATETPQNQVAPDAAARLARGMADLRAVDLHDLIGLLSLQALSPAQLRAHFSDGGEVHVDDKPLLELRAPRALFRGGRATVVKNADQRRRWPPAAGTLLAATLLGTTADGSLAGLPLTTLRGLVRLHVRFAAAPAAFRHLLLAELSRRETQVRGLRAVVFTYGREGPAADARMARDRLLKLAPTDPASLFAAAQVCQRLGDDGRRHLRRCVALGDDGRGRCRRALRRGGGKR